MAIPVIFKGDDTGANSRSIRVTFPALAGAGVVDLEITAFGKTFYYADIASGVDDVMAFTAEETAAMPLGVSRAVARIVDPATGEAYTISNTIKIKVTDCVQECYGGDANLLSLAFVVNSGLPDVSAVTDVSATDSVKTLRDRFNELLRIFREAQS